jgi:hypothetical protein
MIGLRRLVLLLLCLVLTAPGTELPYTAAGVAAGESVAGPGLSRESTEELESEDDEALVTEVVAPRAHGQRCPWVALGDLRACDGHAGPLWRPPTA